jgi:hypothetical protein
MLHWQTKLAAVTVVAIAFAATFGLVASFGFFWS